MKPLLEGNTVVKNVWQITMLLVLFFVLRDWISVNNFAQNLYSDIAEKDIVMF